MSTIFKSIAGTITELSYYENDYKKVEIKKILKEARRILSEMKQIDIPKQTRTFEVLIRYNKPDKIIIWQMIRLFFIYKNIVLTESVRSL